jgi:type I restriction enzyme, S subunit
MKLIKYKVKQFSEIIGGGTPSTKNTAYWGGGIPWITPNDLTSFEGVYIEKGERNITKEGLKKSSAKLLPKNTILLTSRAPVGYVAIAKNNLSTNQGFKNLICDKNLSDPEFVYYLLKINKKYLQSNSTGSTFGELSASRIKNLYFYLPEVNIQKRIASTLLQYDELIDKNHKRIQLLEEAARLLYREWFVYFRFPGHQQVKFIDGIPEGWKNTKIKKLGQIITGKTPSKKNSRNFNGNIPFIKTPDMHKAKIILNTEETLSEIGVNSQKNKVLPSWSILVSCIGTVGVVAMNLFKSQTNQQINSVIPKNKYYRYYSFFCLSRIKPLLKAIGGGSTMANINKNKFENIKIVVPTENLLIEFYHLVDPIFNQIALLLDQNQKFAQARDLLLPRLMSGKIDVSEFDEDSIPVESEV